PPAWPQLRTLVWERVRQRQPQRPLQLPLQARGVGEVERKNRDHRAPGRVDICDCEQSLSGKGRGERAGVEASAGRKESPRPGDPCETLSRAERDGRDRRRKRGLVAAGVRNHVTGIVIFSRATFSPTMTLTALRANPSAIVSRKNFPNHE